MKLNRLIIVITLGAFLIGCGTNGELSDAYGNFEAEEIMVSSEANGKMTLLKVEEGQKVEKGQLIGVVDTTQLYLKKQQLILSVGAIKAKMIHIKPQIDVLLDQKQNLSRELERVKKLKADGAATQKQLDDLQGEMTVVDSKILATKTQLNTQNSGLLSEIAPLEMQIRQIDDQLKKCYLRSPQKGTVLSLYLQEGELATMGRPVLKLADLNTLELKAYVSGQQLSQFKLGEEVAVIIDDEQSSYKGKVTWVSPKAEFTPKIVQTKEERVNLVYAFKVSVPNDGKLKIGMPAEVQFNSIQEIAND